MFSEPVVATTLLALAAATAAQIPATQCPIGDLQCCQSISSAITPPIATMLGMLGIDASDVTFPIGVLCSPIAVVGADSGSICDYDPACCNDNSYSGMLALGCNPAILDL
ncbi:hydrophobin [Lanmaoa asiatica]|nr:hydrophobin [Lanmaoa asiatica]